MDFGVVLQNDPPAWRVVDIAKQAENFGFTHVWTFDSHLLWQEPYVVFSQILSATHRVTVGPMVTNPATRDWTVTASLFATLTDMFGNRTVCGIGRGDSARRTIGLEPVKVREFEAATELIRELATGRTADWNGKQITLEWAKGLPEIPVWVAGYGIDEAFRVTDPAQAVVIFKVRRV